MLKIINNIKTRLKITPNQFAVYILQSHEAY